MTFQPNPTRKRRVTEVRRVLDIGALRGLLDMPGEAMMTFSWPGRQGDVEFPVRVIHAAGITGEAGSELMLCHLAPEPIKAVAYAVMVAYSRPHFGGRRPWFVCGLDVDGKPCLRHCRFLYLPAGEVYFGCRECYRLTYESRQQHRNRSYHGLVLPVRETRSAWAKFEDARWWRKKGRHAAQAIQADAKVAAFINDLAARHRRKTERLLRRITPA